MHRWEKVREHARERYPLEELADGSFSLLVGFEDQSTQRIQIRSSDDFDAPWAELRTPVCKLGTLDPEEALRRNTTLPMGALALEGEQYFLLYRLPLDSLESSGFDRPVRLLARLANTLRKDCLSAAAAPR